MSGRKIILASGEFYHIFNRGLNQQQIFKSKKDYERFIFTLKFYQFSQLPLRLSYFVNLPDNKQKELWEEIIKKPKLVEIISFVLMPNHFHLLLRQLLPKGITLYLSLITNSYTRYFNLKYNRKGDLFEGVFKAVRIESEEQLIHLSRYIHLNPVVSYLIKENQLTSYPYSSLPDYLKRDSSFIAADYILNHFKTAKAYQKFIFNQIDYGKKLEKIKHLLLEK